MLRKYLEKLFIVLTLALSFNTFSVAMGVTPKNEQPEHGEFDGVIDLDNPFGFSRITKMGINPVRSTAALWGIGLPVILSVAYPIYKKASNQSISLAGLKSDGVLFLNVCKSLLLLGKQRVVQC